MDNYNIPETREATPALTERSDLSELDVEEAELVAIQVLTNHFQVGVDWVPGGLLQDLPKAEEEGVQEVVEHDDTAQDNQDYFASFSQLSFGSVQYTSSEGITEERNSPYFSLINNDNTEVLDDSGFKMDKKVAETSPEADDYLETYILQNSSGRGTVEDTFEENGQDENLNTLTKTVPERGKPDITHSDSIAGTVEEIIEETGQKEGELTRETVGFVPITSPRADLSSDSDVRFIGEITGEESVGGNCNTQKMQLDPDKEKHYLLLFSSGAAEEIFRGNDHLTIRGHNKMTAEKVEEIIKEKTGLVKESVDDTTAETLRSMPTSLTKPNSSADSDEETFEEVIGEESRAINRDSRNQKLYVFVEVTQKERGETPVAEQDRQKVEPTTSKDFDSSDSDVIFIGEVPGRGSRLIRSPDIINLVTEDDSNSSGWDGPVRKRRLSPGTAAAINKKPKMSGDRSGSRDINTEDDSSRSTDSSAPSSPLPELEPLDLSFGRSLFYNEYETDSSDAVEYVPPMAVSPPPIYTPSPSPSSYNPEPQQMIEYMNNMAAQLAQNLGGPINDISNDPGNDDPDN